MSKTNVLIADGRKLLREGLGVLLQKQPDLRVVGDADTAEAGWKLLSALDVHVLVLNVYPPFQTGTHVIQLIAAEHPNVKLIALTFNSTTQQIRALLDAGVIGCLTKECASKELVAAIRCASAGERYLSPPLVQAVLADLHPAPGRKATPRLAPRERDVLQQLASGQSTKEIAYALKVGVKTVDTHRRRIMKKLDRYSVAELTQYALSEGLITLERSV